ncbi:MAG: hypothetical protein LQ351_000623 [Letrouitia transgressa]|nr:MAG: hypothetical protein LQ351_000623 [Letrouitia transgressa]
MERPFKRCRLFESVNSDLDLTERRVRNDFKLKSRFESIFEKYGKDFSGIGDEIDFENEEIVVDNGHIKGMVDEKDVGGKKGASKQRHKDHSSGIKNTTCDGPSIASSWESSEEDPLCSLETTITSSAHRRRNSCSKLAPSETVELNGKRESRLEKYLLPEIIKAPGKNVVVQPQRAEYPIETTWHYPLLPVDEIPPNQNHTLSFNDDSDLYSDSESESDQYLSPFGRSLWAVNTSDRWIKWPKWTEEEDDLIRDLKASGSLKAADVHHRFPGRTLGALRYRWSTLSREALRKTDNSMTFSIPKSSPVVTNRSSVTPRQCQSGLKLDITSQSLHRLSKHLETNDCGDEDILASSGTSLLGSRQGDLNWTPIPKTPSSQEMGNRESQGSRYTAEKSCNINSKELTREQPEALGDLRRSTTIDSKLLPSTAADPEKAEQHHPAKEIGALDFSQSLEVKYSQKPRTSSIPKNSRRLENAKETAELSYLTPDSQGSESEDDPPRAMRKRGRPQHPSGCSDPNQAAASQIDWTSGSLRRSVTAVAAGGREGRKRKPDVVDYEDSNGHMQDRSICRNSQLEKHQNDQQPTHDAHRMGLRPRKPRNTPSATGSMVNAHGKSVDCIAKVQRHSISGESRQPTTSVDPVVVDLTGCDDTLPCSDHENQAVEGSGAAVVGVGGKSTHISKYQPNNNETLKVIVLIRKLSSPHISSEYQPALGAIDTAALEKAELPNMLLERHSPLVECSVDTTALEKAELPSMSSERHSPLADCSEIPAVEADDNREDCHPPTQRFRASDALERNQLHTTESPFSLSFALENGDLSDDELSTPMKAIQRQTELTPVPARSRQRNTFCHYL